jgi:hypothetical protein
VVEYAEAASKVREPRTPSAGQAPSGKQEPTRLTFGRYAGWTLADVGRRDPDYLRWLSRHSSGMAFRTRITDILQGMGLPAA